MNDQEKEQDRFRGCLLGLACGDAVGAAVEFKKRGSFPPVTDMMGGGPFGLPVGAWTDDTSMALCLAMSLIAHGGFNPKDQMNRYLRWLDEGYLSSIGRCFDIGGTTLKALESFRKSGEPYRRPADPGLSSNGCIMRLAPVPMFYHRDREQVINWSGLSARTTHGSVECIEACWLLGGILHQALKGAGKTTTLFGNGLDFPDNTGIQAVARGYYRIKSEQSIRGSGYVIESLEAALWCFWTTMDFEEAILRATNLGDDSDSTSAVTGQLAGAYYGMSGIPKHWLEKLFMRDKIIDLADKLHNHV